MQRMRATFLRRRRQPVDGVWRLGQRNLYILPTRTGLLFAALLLVMLVTSLNYKISLGFMLTFFLASIGLAAMWLAHRNVAGLSVQAHAGQPVFAGEDMPFVLRVTAPQGTVRIGIEISAAAAYAMPPLLADGVPTEAILSIPTTRRGAISLPRITIRSVYPFGLFHVWSRAEFAVDGIVYPAPERDAPSFATEGMTDSTQRPSTPADEVSDQLRPYRPGDPLRGIAWKHSARVDTWLSRTGYAGTPSERWLEWDTLPFDWDTERRLSRLCAWVLMAANEDATYGMRLPGTLVTPGRGPVHMRHCLQTLARWRQADNRRGLSP